MRGAKRMGSFFKAALCSDSHNGKIDFEVLLQSRLSSYNNKVWLGRFIVD